MLDDSDDVLDEVIEITGGIDALAKKCRVTKQSVYHWRERGIPPDRIRQLSQLTDIAPERLAQFTQQIQASRRQGLEYWEDAPTRADMLDPEWHRQQRERERRREQIEQERGRITRDAWQTLVSGYPPPRANLRLPFTPPPPQSFAWYSLVNALDVRPFHKHLIMSFARFLDSGGTVYYLHLRGTRAPDYLHRPPLRAQGCFLFDELLDQFRAIARHFDMREARLPSGGLAFIRDGVSLPADPWSR